MWKEKKLHLALVLLLVVAFIGEQPRLQEDLQRARQGISQVLQLNEVAYGWHSFMKVLARSYRDLSFRILKVELDSQYKPTEHTPKAVPTQPATCQSKAC
ncbi:MAG: hypothetical protein AB1489_19365 [Acidobacteriota bacterium]